MPSVLGNTPLNTQIALASDVPGGDSKANSTALAPAYSTEFSYSVGDYVTKDGALYKCSASTSGTWDSTKWTEESVYKNLPYDAELEYIELGNGRWIDTGVNANSGVDFSHTFKFTDGFNQNAGKFAISGAQQYDIILGVVHKNNNTGLSILGWSDYTRSGHTTVNWSDYSSEFTTISLVGTTASVNGEYAGTCNRGTNPESDVKTYFIGKNAGTSWAFTAAVPKVQFKGSKIWLNNSLVRDFIPVRKSGVGYYYDKVSNTLFGKASGSGDLGMGPDKSGALPLMDGTAAHGSSDEVAPIDHVHPIDTSRAPLASPAFTGTPTAPTASSGTNTTQVATTAFVQSAVGGLDLSIVSGKLCVSFEE